MVASKKAQQGSESEIARIVFKDVANDKKNTDVSNPSQTDQVDDSKDSQKKQLQRQFKLKSL
jgi:hypothetical protein